MITYILISRFAGLIHHIAVTTQSQLQSVLQKHIFLQTRRAGTAQNPAETSSANWQIKLT